MKGHGASARSESMGRRWFGFEGVSKPKSFKDGGSSSKRSESSKKFCFEEVSKMRKKRKEKENYLKTFFIF